MSTALLIYGFIGSGKTRLARQLEEERRAVCFTSDSWVASLFGDIEGAVDDFAAALARVETVMEPLWSRCLVLGVDVVLDLGFWARAKRDHVRAVVTALGATSELYEVICDPDVAWQRVNARNRGLTGSVEISRTTFDALAANIEPLAGDEPRIVIDTS